MKPYPQNEFEGHQASFIGVDEPIWLTTITLNSSTTAAELQNVIENIAEGVPTIIELEGDISLTGAGIEIPAGVEVGKIIKLTSASSAVITTIDANKLSRVIFVKMGSTLYLENIIITGGLDYTGSGVFNAGKLVVEERSVVTGNTAYNGGGIYNSGTLIMNGGEISGNSVKQGGGGVWNGADFSMTSGIISGNTAILNGGGVANSSVFYMYDGEISGNSTSNGCGGGVWNKLEFIETGNSVSNEIRLNITNYGVWYPAEYNIINGTISGNTATYDGGGVYNQSMLSMTNVTVSGNISTKGSGGGVYNAGSLAYLIVNGTGYFTDNSASMCTENDDGYCGSGGAIYTDDYSYTDPADPATYANISTAESTYFSGNTAAAAYFPPSNAANFTNIGYATTSITDLSGYLNPLNNYDINYVGATEVSI